MIDIILSCYYRDVILLTVCKPLPRQENKLDVNSIPESYQSMIHFAILIHFGIPALYKFAKKLLTALPTDVQLLTLSKLH